MSALHAVLDRLRPMPLALVAVIAMLGGPARAGDTPDPAEQYRAEVPKTIIELQQFRRSSSGRLDREGRTGTATLTELSPTINSWLLLTLDWGRGAHFYHLQNTDPVGQTIALQPDGGPGLVVTAGGSTTSCDLWSGDPSQLDRAARSGLAYAPLCGGRLYLRNHVQGSQSELEWATDFLRDYVWGGEKIIGLVKQEFFADAYLETAASTDSAPPPDTAPPAGPRPALLAKAYVGRTVFPENLGIAVNGASGGQLALGRWYPASEVAGAYVAALQPVAIAPEILASYPERVAPLDSVESNALDYFVAFDLGDLDLSFILGTDHPRVDWSVRAVDAVRNWNLPGPDGIGGVAPLVPTGMADPLLARRAVAAFVGGFKRSHGAFKYGELALRNHGSHYGFVEEGVVFSKLVPGLSTLFVKADGSIGMKTWTTADDAGLAQIRFARQNGVPLVELDPATGRTVPGPLVSNWGGGNWSGSADSMLRSLRAGACLQENEGRRFLIYGYYSTATPSAMARGFQAFGCSYAMLLDMNALEHTYLAVYVRRPSGVIVEHLVRGMAELDRSADGKLQPRFIDYPDNRDFFVLSRRAAH
ncbi:MAG: hypothetical protein U1E53_10610 [Dongiaceae bacterium]